MTQNTVIRTEHPSDYYEIAEIHALAFTHNQAMGEVALVDVHRHRRDYDPELSLVAEQDGKIVGHTLLTPRFVKIENKLMRAVIVAPVAVHPSLHKTGIGRLMMEEGHRRAVDKKFQFAMLLGHSTYYPRFGYVTNMFGDSRTIIRRTDIPSSNLDLVERRVQPSDLTLLIAWWHQWSNDVDCGIFPGDSILDWISTNNRITSSIVENDGIPIGYVRYRSDKPELISCFLAASRAATLDILSFLNDKVVSDIDSLSLPVHAEGPTTKKFIHTPFEGKQGVWAAGMIKLLNHQNSVLDRYCKGVKSGNIIPGPVAWPVEFDLC